MRSPAFAYVKSKGTHQLYGNASDQPHCFSYIDSTIPLLSASKTSSFKLGCTVLWLYSQICVGPAWIHQTQIFSRCDSLYQAPVTEQTGFKSVFFCVLSFHFFAPKLFACFAVHSSHFNKYTFM